MKKPPPIIPLLPSQQGRLQVITMAVNNAMLQRNILLETILECNGVTDVSTYQLNKEGTALVSIEDLQKALPIAGAELIPQEPPKPGPFATSPAKSEETNHLN